MSNSFLPFRTFQIQVSIENGVFHTAICAISAGGPYEHPVLQLSAPLSNHSMIAAQMSQRFMVHFVPRQMLIHSEITQKKYTKERRGRAI